MIRRFTTCAEIKTSGTPSLIRTALTVVAQGKNPRDQAVQVANSHLVSWIIAECFDKPAELNYHPAEEAEIKIEVYATVNAPMCTNSRSYQGWSVTQTVFIFTAMKWRSSLEIHFMAAITATLHKNDRLFGIKIEFCPTRSSCDKAYHKLNSSILRWWIRRLRHCRSTWNLDLLLSRRMSSRGIHSHGSKRHLLTLINFIEHN